MEANFGCIECNGKSASGCSIAGEPRVYKWSCHTCNAEWYTREHDHDHGCGWEVWHRSVYRDRKWSDHLEDWDFKGLLGSYYVVKIADIDDAFYCSSLGECERVVFDHTGIQPNIIPF